MERFLGTPTRGFRRDSEKSSAPGGVGWGFPACEHAFVTAQGSPYSRFRRAIERGLAQKAIDAAMEIPTLRLDDALDLCRVLAVAGDSRYAAAARRWLVRLGQEHQPTLNEIVIATAALAELGHSPTSEFARETLEHLAGRVGSAIRPDSSTGLGSGR
jgi:hypothetical protein